jgi:FMN phosphatase YigB (HAD superfamily)
MEIVIQTGPWPSLSGQIAADDRIGPISLLVFDIDNTLFDWFDFWLASFSAMVDAVIRLTGIAKETLLTEIRTVHARHGTSEYSFILQELPSLSAQSPSLREKAITAGIDAYQEARERVLHIFPGVKETLELVKSSGAGLVGFTESQLYYTTHRLRRFKLDGVVDTLYCSEDHAMPDGVTLNFIRSEPSEECQLQRTRTTVVPRGIRKPNPAILRQIMKDFNATPASTAYVGDSLYKDVLMAQRAHVHDVFAKYGERLSQPGYDLLRRVSHWTDEDIEEEKQVRKLAVTAAEVVLENGFPELLEHFKFGPA